MRQALIQLLWILWLSLCSSPPPDWNLCWEEAALQVGAMGLRGVPGMSSASVDESVPLPLAREEPVPVTMQPCSREMPGLKGYGRTTLGLPTQCTIRYISDKYHRHSHGRICALRCT